ADSDSRVVIEVIAVARASVVAAVAVAVPRVVGMGIALVSTAAVAVGIPAVLDIPVLVPGSRVVIETDPRVVTAGVVAASRSSVEKVVLLKRLQMLQGPRVLCDHCECAAICRGLPIAQTVRG